MLVELVEQAPLEYLKESAAYPGFIPALNGIIGELKTSLVFPAGLQSALKDSRSRLTGEAYQKISELADLYHRYQEDILLANNLHDREGLMWRALDIVKSRSLGEIEHVVFDGFDQMNNVQLQFLKAIGSKVDEAVVTLTYEPGRGEIFDSAEPVRKFILSLGATEQQLERTQNNKTVLSFLEKNIFRTDAPHREADDTVTIIEGCDRAMEIEMAAMEIKKLLHESALSPADILLTGRDIETYREPVGRIFGEHGLFIEESNRPLAETAPARLLGCCLKIINGGWPRDEVVRYLKSDMIADNLAIACRAEIDAKRLGITGGRKSWLKSWGEKDITHSFRLKCLKPVADFQDALRNAAYTSKRTAAVRTLIGTFKRRQDDRSLAQDAAANKALLQILVELEASTLLIGETTGAGFLRILSDSIAGGSYKPAAAPAGRVQLLPVTSLAGEAYKAVFILGLLEKSFPRQIREEPFLRDRERLELNRNLDFPLPLKRPPVDQERFFFYKALGIAAESLYLCYPLTDDAAKDSLPSFYIDEAAKVLGGMRRLRRDHMDLAPRLQEARSRIALSRAVVYALAQLPASEAAALVYNSFSDTERLALARVLSDSRERPAVIADPKLPAAFSRPDNIYRCTELEIFAACPFSHFCRYTLGLEPIKDEVDGLDLGTLVHDVLYRLFKEFADEYGANLRVRRLDPAAIVARATEIMEEEFNRNVRLANLAEHEAAMVNRDLKARLKRYLIGEIKQGWEGFSPTYFELEFGNPARPDRARGALSTEEPLVLTDSAGRSVAVCGKMDRVDISTAGALIIDYKLGATPNIHKSKDGLTLQVILYALAVKKLFNIDPVGMEYRPIKAWAPDGYYSAASGIERRNRTFEPDEFASVLAECEGKTVELAQRLRSGRIEIDPAECSPHCSFTDICRFDKHKLKAQPKTSHAALPENDLTRKRRKHD